MLFFYIRSRGSRYFTVCCFAGIYLKVHDYIKKQNMEDSNLCQNDLQQNENSIVTFCSYFLFSRLVLNSNQTVCNSICIGYFSRGVAAGCWYSTVDSTAAASQQEHQLSSH